MSLKVDHISRVVLGAGVEEMVETDFVERR